MPSKHQLTSQEQSLKLAEELTVSLQGAAPLHLVVLLLLVLLVAAVVHFVVQEMNLLLLLLVLFSRRVRVVVVGKLLAVVVFGVLRIHTIKHAVRFSREAVARSSYAKTKPT